MSSAVPTGSPAPKSPTFVSGGLLTVLTVIVSALAVIVTLLNHSADSARDSDLHRESELQNYLDKMGVLVFQENLLQVLTPTPALTPTQSGTGVPTPLPSPTIPVGVQEIAIANTANVLRQMENDGPRKGIVVQFLYRAKLIPQINPTISLKNANLQDIDLSNVDLTGINLYQSDLTSAKLAKTTLVNAYLLNANLTGADLKGAILSGANLRGAILVGADLTGSILAGTDLTGADLTGAKGTTSDQVNQAKSLAGATLPDGTKQ
ncbi:MAG TPA: pentapeptide repeat-containing protein [Aggregatilineales bacterium]|nr:pentapeptide repeat-containing protein [Aggregatilineales bacterium]